MKEALRCWAEVDLAALRENLAWLRHRVGPDVKIMTVVKADAYGHGLKQIASLLMQSGTDVFGVANLGEARAIRSVGHGWPILMLGACLPGEVEVAVMDGIRPTISTVAEAKLFSKAAIKAKKTVAVHVKVDTGMGRLGVRPEDALGLCEAILRLKRVEIEGVFTHFSSAEDDAEFTASQARRFEEVLGELKREGIRVPMVHASNSAALLHQPQAAYNLIRAGLLVYGVLPEGQRAAKSLLREQLRPALAWKCRASLVKDIAKGTPLSYGHTFVASRKMKVATLTAGYGDGYSRTGSGKAQVLVGGKRCAVLGRITMDQMIVDVTGVRAVQSGDEAVLIGNQGGETISANEVARWCDTIPWEVLTGISHRVQRVYLGAGAG